MKTSLSVGGVDTAPNGISTNDFPAAGGAPAAVDPHSQYLLVRPAKKNITRPLTRPVVH
jgi:hypothetical protein